ncbi:hypothetical protein MGG_18027 [Pyricularia oryzae 70-15]|uniref:Uncharacterized protein n=3 Tax=Pyricularia oryzae TaxID=318829 RepID=G4NJV7_PYRO7|nr:uncharacterized protein MGG_18027 [Pyricularia oryzae 70-15]EHA46486.1 hypothetical protein MGG_18027 [Pyricularia oryzae 70-15]ELQ35039.1 hypothetical protein OOU_Y34scaffold00728g3 [Pyricularia oryzae Y34]KAI7911619.1 hypothetical protein M0657_010851 [Pyricularia oryzae]KAI7914126.1 hypothetical protein M9X92_009143 [Pyricularia oryzae]
MVAIEETLRATAAPHGIPVAAGIMATSAKRQVLGSTSCAFSSRHWAVGAKAKGTPVKKSSQQTRRPCAGSCVDSDFILPAVSPPHMCKHVVVTVDNPSIDQWIMFSC